MVSSREWNASQFINDLSSSGVCGEVQAPRTKVLITKAFRRLNIVVVIAKRMAVICSRRSSE